MNNVTEILLKQTSEDETSSLENKQIVLDYFHKVQGLENKEPIYAEENRLAKEIDDSNKREKGAKI